MSADDSELADNGGRAITEPAVEPEASECVATFAVNDTVPPTSDPRTGCGAADDVPAEQSSSGESGPTESMRDAAEDAVSSKHSSIRELASIFRE
jgi:hypothetical protein